MNKSKKRAMVLSVSLVVCFSSIYAYANQKVKKDLNTDTEITTIIDEIEPETKIYDSDEIEVETKIYDLDEIEEIMNDSSIQPYHIEYIAESESVTGKRAVNKTLELTDEYKYGKVYFSNNSSKAVTLSVTGTNIDISIPAKKGVGQRWTKDGSGNKTYTISVSSDGTINLDGKISVAKSNIKGELK